MRYLTLIAALAVLAIAAGAVTAQMIDDFEGGDLAAWNIEAPWYTALSVVSPGADGSVNALSIQEITGSQGGHSANALAHRNFTAPQNWTAYQALEMDARISAGEWNGYSIRLYNDNTSILLKGIHSSSATSDFRTIRFDISQVARDQITEIIIYVNKTGQDAGQAIIIDNLKLSATPVSIDPVRVLENFSSGDVSRWLDPVAPPYQSLVGIVSGNSPSDSSAPAQAISAQLDGASNSALFRWRPIQTMDWTDYKTLEFDAKLPAGGTVTDGFSVRVYNAAAPVRLRKFVPSSGYVTCQVDISQVERDQVNEVLFYLNRLSAYDPAAGRPVTLAVDNIRLTTASLPPSPDVVVLDDFDAGGPDAWNYMYQTFIFPEGTDYVSAPASLNIGLFGTSTSAYAVRDLTFGGIATQDWEDYRSLMFEGRVLKGDPTKPNYPVGFSTNVVNGGFFNTSGNRTSGPGGGNLWYYPTGYDQWETYALDLSPLDVEQVNWLFWYVNRCARSDFDQNTATGQIVRIDNLRISKEPAPPIVVDSPDVDDFEDGDITDWYYKSLHSGLEGVTTELVQGGSDSQYAVSIKFNNPPGSSSAYGRKTLHAKWDGYKTLIFDAKAADCVTSQGFVVRLRNFTGSYQPEHPFSPGPDWKTFKIDISKDSRNEVIGLLFYVNRPTGYGLSQNGNQKVFIDNIRLSTEQLPTEFADVGAVKQAEDGSAVTLTGKVCAGFFANAVPDPASPTTMRSGFFIVEPDRSAGIPVMLGSSVLLTDVPAGSIVDVKGTLTTGVGTRFIIASEVTITGSGGTVPDPLFFTNVNCGSPDRGFDMGVPGFSGIDTTGMLGVVAGKILAVGTDLLGRKFMYIDDGSNVEADNGAVGLKVFDWSGTFATTANIGKFVRVTGFVVNDAEVDPGTQQPTFRPVRAFWPKKELATPIQFVN